MKVSREQVQANRLRILDEAGRLFREKGFEAVGVAEVMKAAGLTHGGFYGHFASKDDLIAQTVAHVFEPSAQQQTAGMDLPALVEDYLSTRHRRNVSLGCPTAALAGDIRRQGTEARRAMSQGLRSQLDQIASVLPDGPETRRVAVGAWATLVGAVVLSRAIEDETLAEQILSDARAWIEDHVGMADCLSSSGGSPAR
jgi:TetR/AcrR family transcriptional repressor of nem operon